MLGTGVPEAKVVRDLFHLSIYSLSDTTAAERHAGVRKQDTGHNCKQQNYVAPWGWCNIMAGEIITIVAIAVSSRA